MIRTKLLAHGSTGVLQRLLDFAFIHSEALGFYQVSIVAAVNLHQVAMGTLFDNSPATEDQDAIDLADRRESVGDDDGSASTGYIEQHQ